MLKRYEINGVQTRGTVKKKVVLQGVFVKIGGLIEFKGFLWEFLENRSSWENQKPPEKWTILSVAFYNAPNLHTVEWKYAFYFKFRRVAIRGAQPSARISEGFRG